MLYSFVYAYNFFYFILFTSRYALLVQSQSPQNSLPTITKLVLPPEAKILPNTHDSKILVPSIKNNNLDNTVNTSLPGDTTSPPAGAYIVRRRGLDGEYDSIQAALMALETLGPSGHNATQTIFIYPGNYVERLIVDYKGPLRMMGFTEDKQDYLRNQVNITGGLNAQIAGSDELSATVRIIKDDFAMYNINVYNTYGHQGHFSQAIALSGTGSKQGHFYGCSFFGYQDTLLTLNGYHYYSKCYIEGAVDFIFTQKAVVWFEKVTTASIAQGAISANGRNDAINPSRYVFNRARVLSKGAATGTVYLGRPWGNYSRVMYQYSYLSEVVNPRGWTSWQKVDTRTNHASYTEFKNFGPGSVSYPPNSTYNLTDTNLPADVGSSRIDGKAPVVPFVTPVVENASTPGVPPGSRAPFSRERRNPYQVTQVLGEDYKLWIDPEFPVDPF
ncbi:hypothetical protein CROQUDRAFT_40093 [Cronartium quercuum f. sp. fusiforme G11]|uniref:pectinesterase n=1 Tax=Cronartium quercuum f. sp. fusiforme G11 TaxID=708437 RepID=A0A9P6TEC6_9BASI|nr:hypothetical protein CROQUDRAFT_40093 [Cronartium quercuum f. sp. fusiforme G11]